MWFPTLVTGFWTFFENYPPVYTECSSFVQEAGRWVQYLIKQKKVRYKKLPSHKLKVLPRFWDYRKVQFSSCCAKKIIDAKNNLIMTAVRTDLDEKKSQNNVLLILKSEWARKGSNLGILKFS